MDRSVNVFIATVTLAAAVFSWMLPLEPVFAIAGKDIAGLLCFFGVGILAEALAIDFGTGKQARSSLAFLPFLTCAVLFEPIIPTVLAASVVAISNFAFRRQQFSKGLFNIAQVMLSVGLASLCYATVAGPLLSTPGGINYIVFCLAAVVFFGINIFLTSCAIAVIRRQSILVIVPQAIGPRGSNLWYDLLASPIGIVGAILYRDYSFTGLLIILLPLLLIRYSYISKLQLEEANRDLLKVLVKAIETRDPYTSGHSLRVATLAHLMAKDLDLGNRKVDEIEMAALLHDIGKIDSVYEAVIRKPYDLNAEERTLIKTHATKGADLLQSLSSVSAEVIRAVRHHHERYDGSGYPDGLRADEIPIAARIIMLSDSIDAMLSDRPYRSALSIERVHSELVRCAGTQFDPSIVRVILTRGTLENAESLVRRSGARASDTVAVASTA